MLKFRCYNCWRKIEDESNENYIECPDCSVELYTGELAEELVEASVANPSLHQALVDRLIIRLTQNKELVKGGNDVIAGKDTRHRPDAIYYYKSDFPQNNPIIFEVETCNSINDVNTVSQCTLFSETAKNTEGDFYIVVPKICIKGSGVDLVKNMFDEYGFESDSIEILTL